MSDGFILSNFDIFEFRNSDTNKYSVWVYEIVHDKKNDMLYEH